MPAQLTIGVDLGGTKIEAIAGQRRGNGRPFEVASRKRVPTPPPQPREGPADANGEETRYRAILEAVASLIRAVASEAGLAQLPRIGVAMPGSVTRARVVGGQPVASVVKNSNTTALNGRPFRDDLTLALGVAPADISFANDANCFALAEATLGAAASLSASGPVFGVILGTGTGGGLVLGGRVWDGLQGIAGEWGHTLLFPLGGPDGRVRACYCGKSGCVERYLAGPSVEEDYALRSGVRRPMTEIAARRGSDPIAAAVLELFLDSFGRAVANLIDVLDPVAVVLGGGVSNLDLLYDEGSARVRHYVFNDELLTPIVRNQLGDSAGVFGAALL